MAACRNLVRRTLLGGGLRRGVCGAPWGGSAEGVCGGSGVLPGLPGPKTEQNGYAAGMRRGSAEGPPKVRASHPHRHAQREREKKRVRKREKRGIQRNLFFQAPCGGGLRSIYIYIYIYTVFKLFWNIFGGVCGGGLRSIYIYIYVFKLVSKARSLRRGSAEYIYIYMFSSSF